MPDYKKAARKAAKKYNLDPDIFQAMIWAESNFDPNSGSSAGARGIAQFMPATAKQYGVNLDDGRVSDDLDGAARYLRDNLKRTGGDYRKALSIYNSGKPDKYLPGGYPETIAYVKKIMAKAGTGGDTGGGDTGGSVAPTPAVVSAPTNEGAVAGLQFLASKRSGASAQLLSQAADILSQQQAETQMPETQNPKTPSAGSSNGGGKAGRVGGGPLLELFWQGPGGINVKNGKRVPQGFVSGHDSHVHVASGPETTRRLGKLAQQMGLHVGENKAFGGVNPVHVQNSNHYADKAIDVSGDPAKMRAFAHRVAKMYGVR